jgi:hypothetical protein
MSEFQNRPENIRNPRRRLWHFDGRKTNWKLNVRHGDSAFRRDSDLDNGKLMHYLRMGSTHADIEAEDNKIDPVDRKATVIKWLCFLAAFWIIFKFVRL